MESLTIASTVHYLGTMIDCSKFRIAAVSTSQIHTTYLELNRGNENNFSLHNQSLNHHRNGLVHWNEQLEQWNDGGCYIFASG